MLLEPSEASLFLRLYQQLLGFAAGRLGVVEDVSSLDEYKRVDLQKKHEVRNALYDHPELIDQYADKNPDVERESDLAVIRTWRKFVRGTFFVERDLKLYTILIRETKSPLAYGVLGLTDEIVDLLPVPLPAMVETVLLPWKGQIVWDGMVAPYPVFMGGGIRRNLRDIYREAKQRWGIVTSLEVPLSPPSAPRARATHTAIRRFLGRCPQTVREFKERYGEPLLEEEGSGAVEFGSWQLDGEPALHADHLMVYKNLMKGKLLYVYAFKGKIAHVSVAHSAQR